MSFCIYIPASGQIFGAIFPRSLKSLVNRSERTLKPHLIAHLNGFSVGVVMQKDAR